MSSTTASDHELDAFSYIQWLPKPEPLHILDLYTSPSDYKMVKIGRKEYGFEPYNTRQVGKGLVAYYKCSHLEAQRRFAMMLITRKMMR